MDKLLDDHQMYDYTKFVRGNTKCNNEHHSCASDNKFYFFSNWPNLASSQYNAITFHLMVYFLNFNYWLNVSTMVTTEWCKARIQSAWNVIQYILPIIEQYVIDKFYSPFCLHNLMVL